MTVLVFNDKIKVVLEKRNKKMLLQNVFQKLSFKVLTLLLTAFMTISTPIVAPSTKQPINESKADGVKLTFAAIADPQVSNYMLKRYPVFQESMMDMHAGKDALDAVIVAGDIVENGLAEEYQLVYDGLSGLGCRYILNAGNHDIRLRLYNQSKERFCAFSNALNNDESMNSFYFSEVVNGYRFIVMGSEKSTFEEAYFSDDQLKWLDDELKKDETKPTFVIFHQPLKFTHGLPDTWNSPIDSAGSVGDQSDQVKDILTKHRNVILITGHLHTGFGKYTYETIGDLQMINLPSLCIENKDGEYNGPGIGYIVEVYDKEVVFRARDFSKGEWVSSQDITIPIK